MSDFVTEIYEFNKLAGLLDQPLDDYREASFIIEEALEGFDLQTFPLPTQRWTGTQNCSSQHSYLLSRVPVRHVPYSSH